MNIGERFSLLVTKAGEKVGLTPVEAALAAGLAVVTPALGWMVHLNWTRGQEIADLKEQIALVTNRREMCEMRSDKTFEESQLRLQQIHLLIADIGFQANRMREAGMPPPDPLFRVVPGLEAQPAPETEALPETKR